MSHSVKLDVFEGPLDLLLQLVSSERVNVAEVSISSITDEYLQAVATLDRVDLDVASSFLVMAATLMELKTMKLLPRRVAIDPELAALLEERDRLLHKLIEYSTFKKAASRLEAMLGEGEGFYFRDAAIPEELLEAAPDILRGLEAPALGRAAATVLTPRPVRTVDTSHVAPIRVSVREMADLLRDEILSRGRTSYGELIRDVAGKIEMIVRFLALLELYRTQEIDLDQPHPFGEIDVRWRSSVTSKGTL